MNGKAMAGTLYRCEACGHIGDECLEVPEYATAHGPGGSYVGTCVGVERYCVKCGGDVDIVLAGSVMPKRVCCYCGCALDGQLTTDAREVTHGACEQCVKDVVDSLEEADEGPTCCRCGTPVSEDADSMVVHGRLVYYCGECLAGMREAADDARRDI